MGLDLLFSAWLIIAGLLGFRDGSVRKLTSLVVTGIALFAGHLLMRDVGDMFMASLGISPSVAPVLGFLAVFLALVLVQSIVYKLATDSYKIGGLADRVAGSILGVFQGLLFLSSVMYILLIVGVPSRSTKQYSKMYGSIVNIAPQMLDLFTTVRTGSFEDFEKMARERGAKELNKFRKPGDAAVDSLKNNRLLREVEKRSAKASGLIDSLRMNTRR